MSVEDAMRDRLVNDPEFVTLIPDARLFGAGAIRTPPDFNLGKFAVLRFDVNRLRIGPTRSMSFFLYSYDRPGGPYSHINTVLERAKTLYDTIGQINHGNGHVLNVVWLGHSAQLFDDQWKALTRFATFEVTYSGT